MGEGAAGTWEPPGGGLEHNESVEECLSRELLEELGVELGSLGKIICVYRGENRRGFKTIRIAIETTLKSYDFKYGDLLNAKFVTKEELRDLPVPMDDSGLKGCVDLIWPTIQKPDTRSGI
jgi:ADP-ribose pyrophosphatase YjhB (NUDIX family)